LPPEIGLLVDVDVDDATAVPGYANPGFQTDQIVVDFVYPLVGKAVLDGWRFQPDQGVGDHVYRILAEIGVLYGMEQKTDENANDNVNKKMSPYLGRH
jgi:hypothetical protein